MVFCCDLIVVKSGFREATDESHYVKYSLFEQFVYEQSEFFDSV